MILCAHITTGGGIMWTFEHTETTSAAPAQLWARYADPSRWPEWDHEIAVVVVQGPMAVGTHGILKPVKDPKTHFTFTEIIPEVGFTDVSRLPLARMTFRHRIDPTPTGSRFTHEVVISGPLSRLFARVIGRNLAAGLPVSMRKLARLAETTPATVG